MAKKGGMVSEKKKPLYKVGDRIKVKDTPGFQKWAAGGEFVVTEVKTHLKNTYGGRVYYKGAGTLNGAYFDFGSGVWEENISHRIETIESLKNPFPPKDDLDAEYVKYAQAIEHSLRYTIEAGFERTRAEKRADALEAWFTSALKSMITHYEWAEEETRQERSDADSKDLREVVAYSTGIIHVYSALRHTLADMLVQYDELRARLTPVEPDEDVIR